MPLNVVSLPKRKADPHVIAHLTELLDDARTGNLDQIAIISFRNDGCMSEFINLGSNSYEMLAGLNILSNRLNLRLQD